jgi:hypothetical protein
MLSYKPYYMMESNNKLSFYKGLLLGLLLTGVVSMLWYNRELTESKEAEQRGRWAVEKDALLVGVAHYGVDSITAKPIFEWKK